VPLVSEEAFEIFNSINRTEATKRWERPDARHTKASLKQMKAYVLSRKGKDEFRDVIRRVHERAQGKYIPVTFEGMMEHLHGQWNRQALRNSINFDHRTVLDKLKKREILDVQGFYDKRASCRSDLKGMKKLLGSHEFHHSSELHADGNYFCLRLGQIAKRVAAKAPRRLTTTIDHYMERLEGKP